MVAPAHLALTLVISACLFLTPSFGAVAPNKATSDHEPTYAALAAYKSQWNITLKEGQLGAATTTYTAIHCNYTNVDNTSSCLYPLKKYGNDNVVLIHYTLKNVTAGLKHKAGLTPTTLQVKMCYSPYSYLDRAWRKKNKAYPRLDQNCLYEIASVPIGPVLAAHNGTAVANFNVIQDVPTSSLSFIVRVFCTNNTDPSAAPAVCQYDSTATSNFIGVEVTMGITQSMVGSAIFLACVGPILLVSYALLDRRHYAKTGKPLTFLF